MPDADNRIGGRYRLVRQLAAGGMGTVWEGWDERLHRPVAIKQLRLQPGLSAAEAETASRRVMREARLTARLHHPNAVQVFDVIDDNNRPCLVMQYVPSRSLQDIVQTEGPLDPTAAARIGTQVAAALAAAHRAGIVHRDVKPANVLIAEDGTAKITDFGISHAVDDVTLTSTGFVTGTPAYLAPEVARGSESNFASDVYSLGATLYMAVEGAPPAGIDNNPMAMLHRVASGRTNPPVRSGPITAPLMAMLAGDPSTRPNMVDIANRLTDVHSGATADDPTHEITRQTPALAPLPADLSPRTMALTPPQEERPEARPASPPQGPPPSDRRRSLWPVLIAVLSVVVIGVVIGIVLLSGNSGNHPVANGVTGAPTQTRPPTHPPSTLRSTSRSHSATPPSPSHRLTHSKSGERPTAQPPAAGQPTASQLAGAIVDYFDVVPGNLDAGWAKLTPGFQQGRAGGRANYDSYWNSISRVDVSNAVGNPPGSASATLTYHYKNGRVVTENTTFQLVREGGVLKINNES